MKKKTASRKLTLVSTTIRALVGEHLAGVPGGAKPTWDPYRCTISSQCTVA
jgi:hypothetical protein